jgi:hypothetical protein
MERATDGETELSKGYQKEQTVRGMNDGSL